ncbi:PadR family transcriptional regulator [Microbacterium sp. X-17]|uniref:PadR family transcriptional regulator n=1 Tax=Microbacterium sp. X-17 TaxID=3144404 RepID=UPI0031F56FCE
MSIDRLTPLGVGVLALLHEGDMHPYEMMRVMRARRDDRRFRVTNGTVYHTVARLERAGLIAEVGVDREGNRPERTTYTLTPAGSETVLDWVRRELPRADRPAEFRVALAEAHNLPRDEVAALLSARRVLLQAELLRLRDDLSGAGLRRVPEQFLVEALRHDALLTADLEWLDAFIDGLATGAVAWGIDELPPDFSPHDPARKDASRS